jgi:RNA polymerase sigma-70 factor (ECF subfamily)
MPDATLSGGGNPPFPETQWSLILRARGTVTAVRREALQSLCQRYWRPVYCFCRRVWSKSAEDAEDLTQAFFLMLVEKDALERVDPGRGHFRPYLKTLLRNFERDRHDAVMALKRGGDRKVISIDGGERAKLEDCLPDPRAQDPDRLFDLAWKQQVLERAVERARRAFTSPGREAKMQIFEAHDLQAEGEPPSYAELAARFGVKESDVRNALFEVREQVREEALAELRETVSDPEQAEAEYRELMG